MLTFNNEQFPVWKLSFIKGKLYQTPGFWVTAPEENLLVSPQTPQYGC